MSELMELLEKRQGEKSDEQFANEIGLRGSTLWRYKKRQSDINTEAREKMIRHFAYHCDTVMVGALLVYKTGESKFSESELNELGNYFLNRKQGNRVALAPSN